MELHELLEKVEDPETFLIFAKELLRDRELDVSEAKPDQSDRTARGWVNTEVVDYLESAIAWAEGTKFGEKNKNPWKEFATFLHCGKTYE